MPQIKITDAKGLYQESGSGGIFVEIDTATQITSSETGVTSNGVAGIITTFTINKATSASTGFVLTNSKIAADSVVLVNVLDYDGNSYGIPVATVDDIAAGSCTIRLVNAGSATLGGVCKIGYFVLGAAS